MRIVDNNENLAMIRDYEILEGSFGGGEGLY